MISLEEVLGPSKRRRQNMTSFCFNHISFVFLFLVLFLLKYNWLMILYLFQMYNIVIQYDILQNNHHNTSSHHLSLKSLQYCWLCSLCCTFFPLAYLCYNWKFIPLNHSSVLLILLSSVATITLFSVSVRLFLFCYLCFVFSIPHIREMVPNSSFSVWTYFT